MYYVFERVEILKRIQIRRKLKKIEEEEEENRKEEGVSLSFAKNVVVRLTLILLLYLRYLITSLLQRVCVR